MKLQSPQRLTAVCLVLHFATTTTNASNVQSSSWRITRAQRASWAPIPACSPHSDALDADVAPLMVGGLPALPALLAPMIRT